jgi:hypothetical protein
MFTALLEMGRGIMRQAFQLAAHIRLAVYGLVVLAASASSGCVSTDAISAYIAYNDSANDYVMGWRNSVWARQAWHARKYQFVDEQQFHAFGQGFRDGYVSVASGGNGCPPPLPPRKYWNWRYQTAEGQAQVAAWFAGFPHGARAADEEGAGLYQQIQVSHPIEVQYSPEFQNAIIAQEMIREMIPGAVPPQDPGLEQVMPMPGQPPRRMLELPPPDAGARNGSRTGTAQPVSGQPPLENPQQLEVAPASYGSPVGTSAPWSQPQWPAPFGNSPAGWPPR